MKKTCSACRSRKTRCDGINPVCGPCSRARKPLDCQYSEASTRPGNSKDSLLQKGAACMACRRKKKKCDARRPYCRTCEIAGKLHDCIYEDDTPQSVMESLIARNKELEERVAFLEAQQVKPSSAMQALLIGSHQLFPPVVPEYPAPIQYPSPPPFLPWFVTADMGQNNHSSQPGNSLGDLLLSELRRPYNTVSDTPSDAHLRALYIAHSATLGVYLRSSKCQAIKAGDISGTVVHPAVVHLALLLGGIFWHMYPSATLSAVNEEAELQRAIQSLYTHPPDPVTLVMVYCTLAWYTFFNRRLSEGQAWVIKAHEAARQHHLRILPEDVAAIIELNQPNEDTKEMIATICQLVYFDKAATLVLKLPSGLETEFDQQLKQLSMFQPCLEAHSLVVLRCRSIFFLQEALRLSDSSVSCQPESISTSWHNQYWETLEEVTRHTSVLTTQLLRVSLSPDCRQTVTLTICQIVSLSAQLVLHRLLSRFHPQSRQRALSCATEVVGLTQTFKAEDVSLLDPILGVCWTIVATALRQEKQAFNDTSSVTPDSNWTRAFSVMITCASKVGSRIPFFEHVPYALHEVALESVPDLI
ncbi:hypothetical protein BDW22DRAFT_1485146 [Trametopsis cervina]|nr:hypothetical protein BDW22DRAFT_1485146 [Trametopsis cervina]